MSIAIEISRIQTDRNTIRSKYVELGLAQSADSLDQLAEASQNIENRGAVSVSVQEGETYTIPKGYHNGSGTVSGIAGGGNYTLQSKAAAPTKLQQNITPDPGYYGLSDVTVAPIPEAYQDVTSVTAAAGDVLTGKIYVDAAGKVTAGTMANNGDAAKVLTAGEPNYLIPEGYHSGKGAVKIVPEAQTATPTKAQQVISPAEGKILSQVTVAPIPDIFVDTTDADALAANILADKTAYVNGAKITGTMPNNGDANAVIDGLTTLSVVVSSGFTLGGTVSLTDDIEKALASI